jgi:spermidine/putrescine transport system substrate-binding protein
VNDQPDPARTPIDPALLRGLTQRRYSRRDMLRFAGYGVGSAGLAAFLAACGVKGTAAPKASPTKPGASPSAIDFTKFYGDGKPAGTLNFANWEDYIDVDSKGNSPSLQAFTKQTGIKVNYKTVINDNDPFLAKIIPVLQAGQDTGYDLIVITNGGPIERMIALGFLTPLDHKFLPNWEANADPKTKNPNYDPGNVYTVAWQSGFTGIGYNSKVVKTPPTSFKDLLDPTYKGKVGMFANDQDLPCPALNAMGFDIDKSTSDQWKTAADAVSKARDDGIVRKFYDQSYIDALENGDIVLTQAWSGDIFIASAPKSLGGDGFPEMKFVFPQEGPIYWHDNMAIPLHAQHPVDAITYMNYVYDPKVAAMMADFIWYVTPVPGAQSVVLNDLKDPTVANSPLIFPSAQDLLQAKQYKVFKDSAEKDEWDSIWQPVFSS